jgi:ribonuclease HI
VPGVYLDWPSAQKQITGWTKPKHRCFLTRAEAESFVRHGNQLASVSGDGLDEEPAIDVLSDSGLAHDGEQQQQQQQPSRRVMAHPEVVLLGSAAPSRAVAAAGEGAGAGVDTGGGVASPAKRPRKTNNNGSVNNSASKTAKAQAAAASSYDPSSTSVAAAVAVAAAAASLEHDTGDNFDPTTMLNPRSGKIVKKSEEQMRKTIMQPVGPKKDAVLRIYTDGSALNNGRGGAIGGVGVYFGDGDARLVLIVFAHALSLSLSLFFSSLLFSSTLCASVLGRSGERDGPIASLFLSLPELPYIQPYCSLCSQCTVC